MSSKRRHVWIHHFQTRLMLRVAAYCLFFQVATWFILSSLHRINGIMRVHAPDSVMANGIIVIALIGTIMGLLFICDAMRLAHRVVGPVVRIQRALKEIAEGQEVEVVRLRKGDLLPEIAESVNAMLEALEKRGAIKLKATPASSSNSRPEWSLAPVIAAIALAAFVLFSLWWLPMGL